MNKPVLDAHRFMYRNCLLQAFSLSAPTTPISFVDVDSNGAEHVIPVGDKVWTNEAGYVFYGQGTQVTGSLAVTSSAIIKVMQGIPPTQKAQFIIEVPDDAYGYITADEVGAVRSADGQWSWNPLDGNSELPDFVLRGEFVPGTWAEGELSVDESTPTKLPIDKWTNSIVFKVGAGTTYTLGHNTGRYGQTIAVFNMSDRDISVHTVDSNITSTIKPGACITAVHLGNVWLLNNDATDTLTYRHQTVNNGGSVMISQLGYQFITLGAGCVHRVALLAANSTLVTTGVIVNNLNRPIQVVPMGMGGLPVVVDGYSMTPFALVNGKFCAPKNPNYTLPEAVITMNGVVGNMPVIVATADNNDIGKLATGADTYKFDVYFDPQALNNPAQVDLLLQVPQAWFDGRILRNLRIVLHSMNTTAIPACSVNAKLTAMDLGSQHMSLGTVTIAVPTLDFTVFNNDLIVEAE